MGGGSSKDVTDENGANGRPKGKRRKNLLLETLDDHEESINCMTLSDDGSLLVTGGEDCTARMWSTKTDTVECLGVLEGHIGYITCIAIVDTYVVTGSADTTVRKWQMTTCDCLYVYQGHTARICRIIATDQLIFSSSYDKLAMVWLFDADHHGGGGGGDNDGKKGLLKTFRGHFKAVYPMVFIPASGIPSEVSVEDDRIDINPGDLLITGSADCTARSWAIDSGACLKTFEGHTMPIMCMSADATGQTLFTGGGDHTVKSWLIKSGVLLHDFVGHGSAVIGLQVINRMLYTISCDQTARLWVAEFGDCTRIYKGHNHSVTCMKYYNGIVFTGCGDGIARAFDAKSGSLKDEFKGHPGSITALAVVNTKLCTSCVDGKLRVFDASHLIDEDKVTYTRSLLQAVVPKERLERNNQKLLELESKLDDYVKDDHVIDAEEHMVGGGGMVTLG